MEYCQTLILGIFLTTVVKPKWSDLVSQSEHRNIIQKNEPKLEAQTRSQYQLWENILLVPSMGSQSRENMQLVLNAGNQAQSAKRGKPSAGIHATGAKRMREMTSGFGFPPDWYVFFLIGCHMSMSRVFEPIIELSKRKAIVELIVNT